MGVSRHLPNVAHWPFAQVPATGTRLYENPNVGFAPANDTVTTGRTVAFFLDPADVNISVVETQLPDV